MLRSVVGKKCDGSTIHCSFGMIYEHAAAVLACSHNTREEKQPLIQKSRARNVRSLHRLRFHINATNRILETNAPIETPCILSILIANNAKSRSDARRGDKRSGLGAINSFPAFYRVVTILASFARATDRNHNRLDSLLNFAPTDSAAIPEPAREWCNAIMELLARSQICRIARVQTLSPQWFSCAHAVRVGAL